MRFLFRLWRWLRTPIRNRMSDDWIQEQADRSYDDNPRAQAKRRT